jgi:hypothetical protein
LPNICDQVLSKMSNLIYVSDYSQIIGTSANNSWSYHGDDVYHTEFYTYTTTDSDGTTSTHTGTREVYDYTIHHYYFNPSLANQTINYLNEMIEKIGSLTYPEDIIPAKEAHELGIKTLVDSWKNYKVVSNDQAVNIILSWDKRTTYNVNRDSILSLYSNIVSLKDTYVNTISTSHDQTYQTYSSFDSGPIEYQTAKNIGSLSISLNKNITEIVNPIVRIKDNSDLYLKSIYKYFVNIIEKGVKEDNRNNIIIQTANDWYKLNFKDGTVVDYFDYLKVILLILLYIAIYSLIVFLVYKKLLENI